VRATSKPTHGRLNFDGGSFEPPTRTQATGEHREALGLRDAGHGVAATAGRPSPVTLPPEELSRQEHPKCLVSNSLCFSSKA